MILYGTFNLNIFIELFQSPLNCHTVLGKSLYNPIRLTHTHTDTPLTNTHSHDFSQLFVYFGGVSHRSSYYIDFVAFCAQNVWGKQRDTRTLDIDFLDNNNNKMTTTTTTYLWFLCHSLFMRHGEVGAQYWEVGGKVGRCRPGTYCLHSATIIHIWTWRRLLRDAQI